jgi:hypothetical protein
VGLTEDSVGGQLEDAFAAIHDTLASTIHVAGPWAIPMVVAMSGLVALANKDRMASGVGVLLVLATVAAIVLVLAFQDGRI